MQTIQDNDLFAALSEELTIRFVTFMARLLHTNTAAIFDLQNLTPDANNLLHDMCFFGIAQFEEQSGIEQGTERYVPRPTFTPRRATDGPLIVGDTIIHGLLSDEVLAEGVARAKAQLGLA